MKAFCSGNDTEMKAKNRTVLKTVSKCDKTTKMNLNNSPQTGKNPQKMPKYYSQSQKVTAYEIRGYHIKNVSKTVQNVAIFSDTPKIPFSNIYLT